MRILYVSRVAFLSVSNSLADLVEKDGGIGWGTQHANVALASKRETIEKPSVRSFDKEELFCFLKTNGFQSNVYDRKLQVSLDIFDQASPRALREYVKAKARQNMKKMRYKYAHTRTTSRTQ